MITADTKRYRVLDTIRGLALISMIIYHGIWDLVYIFGVDIPWYESKAAHIWQQSICCTFILLSGFCWSFGKKKFRRGILVLFCSIVISIVTLLFMPESKILFGVLTLIGTSALIMIPLSKLTVKINPFLGFVSGTILFLITKEISNGVIGIGGWEITNLPECLYINLLTTYLGFPYDGFSSADYFPVIPWFFLFITGYFLFRIFVKYDILNKIPNIGILPFEWIGKKSLLIYMFHQPIVYCILFVLFKFI